jgi:hypothetical protein
VEIGKLDKASEAKWIRKRVIVTEHFDPVVGNQIGNLFPTMFQSYCKVFHNIYQDNAIEDHSTTWDDVEKRKTYDPTDPVANLKHTATTVYGGTDNRDRERLTRLRWSELAEQYGLRFHGDINQNSFTRNFPGGSWPFYLIGPQEGNLEVPTCGEIVRSIIIATGGDLSELCYFLYDLIATQALESDLLFSGPLRSIFETYELDEVHGTPTFWWPADRNWLVCTDWDLTFTVVGGSSDLIAAIVSNPELEAITVEPSSRVDFKSDTINP